MGNRIKMRHRRRPFATLVVLLLLLLASSVVAYRRRRSPNHPREKQYPSAQAAYVINLRRRADRMRHMRTQIVDRARIPTRTAITDVRRVEAVPGDALDLPFLRRVLSPRAYEDVARARGPRGFRTGHAQLTPGAVGCYLSHIETWKRVVRDLTHDDDHAWIFEDDIDLPHDFVARARTVTRHVPDDWDLVLFGYCARPSSPSAAKKDLYRRLPSFLCLHAYAIRKRTARALLARPDLFPMTQQIDWYLRALGLNVYGPPKPFVFQRRSLHGTDIQKPVIRST